MNAERLLRWEEQEVSLQMKVKSICNLFTWKNCIRLRLMLGYTRKQWSEIVGIPVARIVMLENNVTRIRPIEALAYAALAPASFIGMFDENVETAERMFPCSKRKTAVQ